MISPHTPPGTKVRCLVDGYPDVAKGEVVTLRAWVGQGPYDRARGNFIFVIDERPPMYHPVTSAELGYGHRDFQKVELPKSLTSLLTSRPVVIDDLVPEVA